MWYLKNNAFYSGKINASFGKGSIYFLTQTKTFNTHR